MGGGAGLRRLHRCSKFLRRPLSQPATRRFSAAHRTGSETNPTVKYSGDVTGRLSESPSQPLATQAAFHLERSMQANRNNEDAPEHQYEIADAKQSQPRLVC
jgi:hypothetical protein